MLFFEIAFYVIISEHLQTTVYMNVTNVPSTVSLYALLYTWYKALLGASWSWSYGGVIYNYICHILLKYKGPSWSWSHGSWIYSLLSNQYLKLLTLWVRIPFKLDVLDTTLCDKVYQLFGRWFSPCTPVSSTNKTDASI